MIEVESNLIQQCNTMIGEHSVGVGITLHLRPITKSPVLIVFFRHITVAILTAIFSQSLVGYFPQPFRLDSKWPPSPPQIEPQRLKFGLQMIRQLVILEMLALPRNPPIQLGHIRLWPVSMWHLQCSINFLESLEGLVALVPHYAEVDFVSFANDKFKSNLFKTFDPIWIENSLLVHMAHSAHPMAQRRRPPVREFFRHVGVSMLFLEVDQLLVSQVPLPLDLI
mmetsp:Transcript_42198/g.76127  ORF Transcript_42198/g.76127 Transcript_42198/m.76127 type:complete len:224 (-) Transcript_42198:446-1117(-)